MLVQNILHLINLVVRLANISGQCLYSLRLILVFGQEFVQLLVTCREGVLRSDHRVDHQEVIELLPLRREFSLEPVQLRGRPMDCQGTDWTYQIQHREYLLLRHGVSHLQALFCE